MAVLNLEPTTKHVALYLRISDDKTGLAEGVDVQERQGRAYAAEAWPGLPVAIYCDNDLSAASDDIYRPEFERLRADIATGKVAQVWAVEQTRLSRTRFWFVLADEFERAGIGHLHTRRDGIIDVADLAADVGAVVSIHEIRKLRKRVRDKQDDAAAQGRPHGGPIFGYEHVTDDQGRKNLRIVEEQAALIREAARRILAGEPRSRVAKDFAKRGIKGAKGADIGENTVRRWFDSTTIAGLRAHRGELLRDDNGELVRGIWEPILDVETWEAVRAKIDATAAKGERPTRRKYLLSGLAWCAACERNMTGNTMHSPGRPPRARYLCKGCGCSMNATQVDEHVTERLLDRLDHLAARLAEDEHAQTREELNQGLAVVKERRKLGARMLAREQLDEDGYAEFKAELDTTEARLSRDLAELPPPAANVDTDAVRKAWLAGTITERREIAGLWIDHVAIAKPRADAPRGVVDLGRVTILGPGWD